MKCLRKFKSFSKFSSNAPSKKEPETIISRPSWDDYFFGLAFLISQRSPDLSTKHGTVGADKNHRIIGCGYNGFVRGVNDAEMPQARPDKYRFVQHSETNFLHNVSRPIRDDDVVYITGYPCIQCFSQMVQAGLKDFRIVGRRGYSIPPESQTSDVERICEETGVSLKIFTPNLNWLYDEDLRKELVELGFVV